MLAPVAIVAHCALKLEIITHLNNNMYIHNATTFWSLCSNIQYTYPANVNGSFVLFNRWLKSNDKNTGELSARLNEAILCAVCTTGNYTCKINDQTTKHLALSDLTHNISKQLCIKHLFKSISQSVKIKRFFFRWIFS